VVKKISAAVVQRVPLAFSDEEMENEPRRTGFFFCICCDLGFNVHRACTPSYENEFVDVETFSDVVPEAAAAHEKLTAIVSSKAETSKALAVDDEESLKFDEDLECTVDQSGGLLRILL
jgi:hypothetical protein